MATTDTQDKGSSQSARPMLILLPLLILAGLLLVPSTHTVLQNQLTLLVDTRAYADRIRDYGVKTGPIPMTQKWEQSRPAALIAQNPQDYTLQVAGALQRGASSPINSGASPQSHYAGFQQRYGNALTAISQRFPNQPGVYAHLLRFMAQGAVRVSREAEAAKFQRINGTARPMLDLQVGYADSWAAYDAAAAQGEKIDPDNAFFPLMRAIGLFDARRDQEGLAAVLRAGQKTRFEDYSREEPEAILSLYHRAYGIDSALLRDFAYGAVLMPHYAAIRGAARLVVAKAAQAEKAGRVEEGLALRHALMQCGIRMREQGSLICALVGIACYSLSMHSPGGVIPPPPPPTADDEMKHTLVLEGYQDYLNQHQKSDEAAWVTREDAVNVEVRHLGSQATQDESLDKPIEALPNYWMTGMLLLANTLCLLGLCLLATILNLCKVRNGDKALLWGTTLLLLGCLLAAMPMQWAECFTQMQLLIGPFTENGSAMHAQGMDMSDFISKYPVMVHFSEVAFSLATPALVLIAAGGVSLVRKETYAAALRRSLQRGAVVSLTLLVVTYAGMLFATARMERQANTVLTSRTQNAVAYFRSKQSGHAK